MDPVTKTYLDKFRSSHSLEDYVESEAFELFSAYACLSDLADGDYTLFDFHLGQSEFGVDSIAVVINDTVVVDVEEAKTIIKNAPSIEVNLFFIPTKMSAAFDYGDMAKFFDQVNKLCQGQVIHPETEGLTDFVGIYKAIYSPEAIAKYKKNPILRLFYVTTGSWTEPPQAKVLIADRTAALLALNRFSQVTFQPIGATELQKLYRRASSAWTATAQIAHPHSIHKISGVQESFIGIIKCKEFLKLISSDNGMLKDVFYENIRDYDPSSVVNAGIASALRSNIRDAFVLFHNGVTIVTRQLNRVGDHFEFVDYQIVNGCQTSHILYQNRDLIDDSTFIPIKLVHSSNDEIVNGIIHGTNSQNTVQPEQLWATEAIHKDIETLFEGIEPARRLSYERRRHQFKASAVEKARIIQPQQLVSMVAAAFLKVPNRAGREYKEVRDLVGSDIFVPGHHLRPYYTAAYAYYRLLKTLQGKKLKKHRIFIYYMLNAIASKATAGVDVFKIKRAEMEKICGKIEDLCSSTEKLSLLCGELGDRMVAALKKIKRPVERDSLRSDAALANLKAAGNSVTWHQYGL